MDGRNRSAVEAVRRYVLALQEIRERLFVDLPEVADVRDLLSAVRSARTLPREGRSASGIEYVVHGAGSRMADERGREVDVDLIDNVEAFDGWRIRWFTYGGEDGDLSADDLTAACCYLAGQGELQEVRTRRWFAIPAR